MKNSKFGMDYNVASLSRREALFGMGAGLGSVAFSSLLQGADSKIAHHPAKAKNCIFLFKYHYNYWS